MKKVLHKLEEKLGSVLSNWESGKAVCKGGPLESLGDVWGPEHLRGRAWLIMGGKGSMDFGGHFAVFIDVGGNSSYADSGGEQIIPHVFVGIIVQLGLLEKDDGTKLRIAYPIISSFDGIDTLFDPGTSGSTHL